MLRDTRTAPPSTTSIVQPGRISGPAALVPAPQAGTTVGLQALSASAIASSATVAVGAEAGSTVAAGSASPKALVGPAPVSTTVTRGASVPKAPKKPKGPPPVPFSELHKRAVLIMMPTGYAAHVHKTTGENLEVFLAWYIGTFYNEEGLFIAPIFSLLIGADAKWSFISEKKYRPAVAIGYYGGLAVPFTGGAVQASSVASDKIEQTFIHNGFASMSKRVGFVTATGGAMYGIKKPFALFLPMLRNSSYAIEGNPASEAIWTAFGGLDVVIKKMHIKLEVITLPDEKENRPWLIQSHIDAFLGFDIGYTRDRLGYQVVGYYLLPFMRWPSRKRMEKERDRMRLRRK